MRMLGRRKPSVPFEGNPIGEEEGKRGFDGVSLGFAKGEGRMEVSANDIGMSERGE